MTGPKSAKNHTLCAGQITRRTRHIERTRVPRRIIFINTCQIHTPCSEKNTKFCFVV